MRVTDSWKQETEDKLNRLPDEEFLDKAPNLVKRCPRCKKLSLQFDHHTGRVHCTKCGFDEHITLNVS